MPAWRVTRQPFPEVAAQWRAMGPAYAVSPFLSAGWHQALHELAGAEHPLETVAVRDGERTVGLASLGQGCERRLRVLPSRVLYLNETGDPRLDRLTVEHNGLLAAEAEEPPALAALLASLLERGGWDECSLGWWDEARWRRVAPALAHLPLTPVVHERRTYRFIELEGVDGLDAFLGRLRRNTRQQLRRALRAYGGEEAVAVETASGPRQAQSWLDALAAWHQSRWEAQGRPGAFADPRLMGFHRRWLALDGGGGQAQLLRVSTREGPIGYLYNLAAGDYLCNYQGGFAYDGDAKRKPGLVCHALAAAEAARAGMRRYDLLMGDSRYKRSLAGGEGQMVRLLLQRRRWRLRLERRLREWGDGRRG